MRATASFGLLLGVLLVACGHKDTDAELGNLKVVTQRGSDSGAASTALGAGDVRIVSMDGGVDLALIGDSISSGLSRQTLAKVRKETDTGDVKGNGFGASIEKMVKGTVQSAIGTRVVFPLTAIRDVRYVNGRIEFDWAGKSQNYFGHANVNNKDLLESFSPAESQRFVDAVRARRKSLPAM